MDVKEIACEGVEWIQLVENGFQERIVVSTVVKQVCQKALSFIQCSANMLKKNCSA
jgi:hypothetical protein